MSNSHTGKLLVATPALVDLNFYRTVVLVLQHDHTGSVGVILNRPTEEAVVDHLPAWAGITSAPRVVHFGGPVDPAVAIGVAITSAGESTGVPGLSLIDLGDDPDPGIAEARVYSGYSGWGPGQLEGEITEGSWYVVQASPDDPFDRPQGQWNRVLRRQSGYLALVANFPDDVRMN